MYIVSKINIEYIDSISKDIKKITNWSLSVQIKKQKVFKTLFWKESLFFYGVPPPTPLCSF